MQDSWLTVPIVQIDAFTSRAFAGNPAAVMVMERFLPDATLQAIATENNLAETAFLVRDGDDFLLRWFTPAVEVDLCGHATLASAHHVLNTLQPGRGEVTFNTKSGPLRVARQGEKLVMDFPARPLAPAPKGEMPAVESALGKKLVALSRGWVYMAELEDEAAVRGLRPKMSAVEELPLDLIVTARGSDCDFVSRFFAPKFGVPEDPVTGIAHCSLGPYWGAKLGRRAFFARQVSARGGEIWVELAGDRVKLAGNCVEILAGTMRVLL